MSEIEAANHTCHHNSGELPAPIDLSIITASGEIKEIGYRGRLGRLRLKDERAKRK